MARHGTKPRAIHAREPPNRLNFPGIRHDAAWYGGCVIGLMAASLFPLESFRPYLERLVRSYGLRDAEDIVQEAYLVLHRRGHEVADGAERAFLVGTVRRLAFRAKQRAARSVAVADLDVEDAAPSTQARLEGSHERALLDDAMAGVPDDVREVFSLFELDGLTKYEVAAYFGIPVGTAATRRARARRAVLDELRRAVVSRSAPCVAARSRLFVAGRGWYGARGLWPRYVASLPASLREGWSHVPAADWVPLDTAMSLYGASSALDLTEDDEVDVGRHIFGCINGRQVDALVRLREHDPSGTALAVVEHASQLWGNAFEGGDVHVRRAGDRSAELTFRAPMFTFRFFRNCIFGAVSEALASFWHAKVRIQSSTRRSLVLAASV